MATAKQKKDLIAALKFTPRDIEISLSGYGGEIAIGRIPEAAYDYWEGRDDLADFAYDWNNECGDVPADARFITDGCWYEVDDICHENGCEASESCQIVVDDKLENKTVWESNLDIDNLAANGVDTQRHSRFRPNDDEPDGTCIFVGQSVEKGTFFSGTVRITEPFDPAKLQISWNDCDGWHLIDSITYNGEELDGHDAYSTTGKSSEFRVYRVEQEDWDPKAELDKIFEDFPLIEGEEMWAQEAIDRVPEEWNGIPLTKWWPGNFEPYHRGEYEVMTDHTNWPFPQRARWTGSRWLSDGVMIAVRQWRGLCQPVK